MSTHETVLVQVWVDVDKGIAEEVQLLNRQPNVRTFASCQGGLSHGPYVLVGWKNDAAFDWLSGRGFIGKIDAMEVPADRTEGQGYLLVGARQGTCADMGGEAA